MNANLRPLTMTITPSSRNEWAMALVNLPVGSAVSDRDGDIWRKRDARTSGWKRDNGGWSDAYTVASYAPLFEYREDS